MGTSRRVDVACSLDRASLHEKALQYLDRFDATATRLGEVLRAVVDRAIARSEVERRNEAYAWCEQVVARCVEARLIDDSRYASSAADGMRRRGASASAIVERLVARGVDRETALATLNSLSSERQGDSELEAARALVRRRRLGHFRSESERRERRHKDLAVLARAGFSVETARRALESQPDDDGDF